MMDIFKNKSLYFILILSICGMSFSCSRRSIRHRDPFYTKDEIAALFERCKTSAELRKEVGAPSSKYKRYGGGTRLSYNAAFGARLFDDIGGFAVFVDEYGNIKSWSYTHVYCNEW